MSMGQSRHLPLRIAAICAALCLLSSCRTDTAPQTGDLIFFTGDSSSMDDAISSSTGDGFVHVAIVEVDSEGTAWLIDATPQKGVSREKLETKLLEEKGKAVLMRLKDSTGVTSSVQRAKSLIGSPYDFAFLPDNDAYYCSELVYECFLRPDGSHIFSCQPMNFLDSEGNLPEYWKELFEKLQMDAPQGLPGTNPEDLSRSTTLRGTSLFQE